MSTSKDKLKYLWTAHYRDGSSITQPKDDKSRLTPYDPETDFQPSAYRDINQDEVVKFEIKGSGNTFTVDLQTGLFSVNGIEFSQHQQNLELSEAPRLIYFRQIKKDLVDNVWQEAHIESYHLGWQAKDKDGNNVQYVMGVA